MTEITIEESTEQVGSRKVCVLRISGYLDGHTYQDFEARLGELLDAEQYSIVVDFEKLNYISSAGLGAILNAHTRLREQNGDLKIASLSEKTQRLFDLLGFSHVLSVYDTAEAAVQAFES